MLECPAGANLRARGRLRGVEAKPEGTLVTTETAVHVAGQEKPSLLYEGLARYTGKR